MDDGYGSHPIPIPHLIRVSKLLSGGWIPWLNILVEIKVTLGSWAMVQLFVRCRGLF